MMMALVDDSYDDGDGADSDGSDEHLLGGQLFQGRQNSPPKIRKIVSIKASDFYQVSNGSIWNAGCSNYIIQKESPCKEWFRRRSCRTCRSRPPQ